MKASLVLLSLFILLAGCGPATVDKLSRKQDTEQLTPKAVLSLVEGNTLFLHSVHEDTYVYFDTSGKLFGKDIYNNQDIGRWDVSEEGELCMRMHRWWYGDLKCYQLITDADRYYLANSAGVLEFKAELSTGDNKKLYQVTKTKRKSYRRSIRKQSQEDTQQLASPEQSASLASSETASPSVQEPASMRSSSSGKDLRTTVKWMARDCENCNLSNTDLKKADLVGAKLAGANLSNASLRMANMRRADLHGANLKAADLMYTNLPGANLKNANLQNANLKGANLIRANLTGANLEGADLTDALLEGTIGISR